MLFRSFSAEGQRGPDATGDPDPIWAEVFRAAILDLKDPWKGEKKRNMGGDNGTMRSSRAMIIFVPEG